MTILIIVIFIWSLMATSRIGPVLFTVWLPGATVFANAVATTEVQRVRCGTRTSAPCSAPQLTLHTVSAGYTHSCGVSSEGFVYCWGDGRQGALGHGALEISQYPKRVRDNHAFTTVAAGSDFTCALNTEGEVYCWGNSRTVPGWPTVSSSPLKVTTIAQVPPNAWYFGGAIAPRGYTSTAETLETGISASIGGA